VFHNADCVSPKVLIVIFLKLTQHREHACGGLVHAAWAFNTGSHLVPVSVRVWKQCVFENHCAHTDVIKADSRGLVVLKIEV